MTVGTSIQLKAEGVSATGNKAEMPAGYTWEIPQELSSYAEITADGTFTAKKVGNIEVRLVLDGEVIGSKTVYCVIPDAVKFTRNKMDAVYGSVINLPIFN